MKASASSSTHSLKMVQINVNRHIKLDIPKKHEKSVKINIHLRKKLHRSIRTRHYDDVIQVSSMKLKGYPNHLRPYMLAYRRVRYRDGVKKGLTFYVIDDKYKMEKEDFRYAVYDSNKSWLRMCDICDNFVQYREHICCSCGALPMHDKGIITDAVKDIVEPSSKCRTKYTDFTLQTYMEKMKDKPACTIQTAYRMHRQRMQYRWTREAITTIQKCWRRKKTYITLHKIMELKKQMDALKFN